MVDEKIVADLTSKPHRSSLLLIVAIASVIIVVAGALYFSLQKSTIKGQSDRIATEIVSLQGEIESLEGQKVAAARLAQQMLATIEQEEIKWSRVISRIQSLIPYDATTQEAKVKFLSYSGSKGGQLNLNAQTRPQRQEPFNDVGDVIAVFNDSSFFSNAFVPSITRGETEEGQKIGSFIFNVEYSEIAPEEFESFATETETSGETGVSR